MTIRQLNTEACKACEELTPEGLRDQVNSYLPSFGAIGIPERVPGGYLNFVFRVHGERQSAIAKCAPPHVAAMPEVALDPQRIVIEGRSLAAFMPGGELAECATADVRPPHLLHFEEEQCLLIEEDVGDVPHLGVWLTQKRPGRGGAWRVGELLGAFVGRLHLLSHRQPHLANHFDNAAIQRTRLEVQYRNTADLLARGGVSDVRALGQRAVDQGELLQEPGQCVIHGDLWPPSILMAESGIRLIDWELAHFGRPSQDVGHLASHLWMWAHQASTATVANRNRDALQAFLDAYRTTLGRSFGELFGAQGAVESAIHFGCEILVRTVGAFQEGYLYEGLAQDDPVIGEAVDVAARHIREPEVADTFASLRSQRNSSTTPSQ